MLRTRCSVLTTIEDNGRPCVLCKQAQQNHIHSFPAALSTASPHGLPGSCAIHITKVEHKQLTFKTHENCVELAVKYIVLWDGQHEPARRATATSSNGSKTLRKRISLVHVSLHSAEAPGKAEFYVNFELRTDHIPFR